MWNLVSYQKQKILLKKMVTQIEIEEKNTAKYNIPMLEKSFELLEFLVNYPSGLPMQEIVNLLDTPKTTIYRLLNSLQSMGYLTKDIDTQRYFLSKRFLRLGLAALGESNIVEQSLAPMRALRDTIKESSYVRRFYGEPGCFCLNKY